MFCRNFPYPFSLSSSQPSLFQGRHSRPRGNLPKGLCNPKDLHSHMCSPGWKAGVRGGLNSGRPPGTDLSKK
jgi:hypothetical protein